LILCVLITQRNKNDCQINLDGLLQFSHMMACQSDNNDFAGLFHVKYTTLVVFTRVTAKGRLPHLAGCITKKNQNRYTRNA
jgi:hypothetical protein